MENHHAIHGKIKLFRLSHGFNSYVTNYQMVSYTKSWSSVKPLMKPSRFMAICAISLGYVTNNIFNYGIRILLGLSPEYTVIGII